MSANLAWPCQRRRSSIPGQARDDEVFSGKGDLPLAMTMQGAPSRGLFGLSYTARFGDNSRALSHRCNLLIRKGFIANRGDNPSWFIRVNFVRFAGTKTAAEPKLRRLSPAPVRCDQT